MAVAARTQPLRFQEIVLQEKVLAVWHMGEKKNAGMRCSDWRWLAGHFFVFLFLLLNVVVVGWRGAVKLAWCGVRDRYHGRASQLEAVFECAERSSSIIQFSQRYDS